MTRVAIVGASGYIGGELLRILLGHPLVEVAAATSDRFAGRRVDGRHPNLRGLTDLTFLPVDRLGTYDVLFLAAPHRETMRRIPYFLRRAGCVIDLSADFRLRDPDVYAKYYGVPHVEPALVATFRRGLPELWRDELRTADRISVPGCMAAAAIIALTPVAEFGLAAGVDEQTVRGAFRKRYAAEPFVRIVAQRRGLYRYPEPKILSGSNFCDVGFAVDELTGRATVIGALDNLVKGGAGNAVQCLNVRLGWPERTGLEFPGLHPN
jgi:LysW-gamma-L-alpha-aminoadipyl-6-phosphate/LysW-L-glutamyl-5-phosphate reductase